MKVELIHEFPQLQFPFLNVFDIVAVKLFRLILLTNKFNSVGYS
jgi:hypothetical protein